MYEVRLRVPFQSNFQEIDDQVENVAGRPSDFSGAGMGERDYGWVEQEFNGAVSMKDRLVAQGYSATVREK
jgi:hypothetical protein